MIVEEEKAGEVQSQEIPKSEDVSVQGKMHSYLSILLKFVT